jgi:hypothetical protein
VRTSLIGHEDSIQSVRFLASNPVTDILHEYNLYLPSWAVLVLEIPVAVVAYLARLKPLTPALKWIASVGREVCRRYPWRMCHLSDPPSRGFVDEETVRWPNTYSKPAVSDAAHCRLSHHGIEHRGVDK